MAAPLDFSDLTGKKKTEVQTPPQQTNAQGFYSPDKVPQKEAQQPSGLGYPVQSNSNGDELMQLFPTPVLICQYPINYYKDL